MIQNINLLDELTIQPIATLNSKVMTKIALAWILLLFCIYTLAYNIHSLRQKELTNLETVQKNLSLKVSEYKQKFPDLKAKKLEDSKANIYVPNLTNTAGFYLYLEDLAKIVPNGLWINEMVFSKADGSATITGSAVIASSIPDLINSLGKSPSFQNKKFNTLQLQENLDTHNTDFTISTMEPISNNPKEPNKKR